MSDLWGNDFLSRFSGCAPRSLSGARIVFLVGSLDVSGGSNLILHYAGHLQSLGAEVVLAHKVGIGKDADWHPAASSLKKVPFRVAQRDRFDLAVATWWPTVFDLAKMSARQNLYFVQSLESRFARSFLDSRSESLAAATYLLGLPVVTVATWIYSFLSALGNNPIWLVRNGIDKERFATQGPARAPRSPQRRLRVLVEGPLGVPIKAVSETIDACRRAGSHELWHVSPAKAKVDPRVDVALARVPYSLMPQIYRSIDVLVKLSRVEGMFGPPLEAFHCGATAVVSEVSGFDEYIENGVNSLSVPVDDFLAAEVALKVLLEQPEELDRLKRGALETASQWPSIQRTAREFASVCIGLLHSESEHRVDMAKLTELKMQIRSLAGQGEDPRQALPNSFRF